MRVGILVVLVGLSSIAQAAGELAAFDTDGERAAYCFYANTLRMQFAGAVPGGETQLSTVLGEAEQWQQIISDQLAGTSDQRAVLQRAQTALTQRVRTAGSDPRAVYGNVIEPIAAECDALRQKLLAVAAARAKPTAPQPAPAAKPAVANTPVDDGSDVFAGLVRYPLWNEFRWNPHSSVYAKIRARGDFKRIRNGYQLKFQGNIKTLCVGDLMESHRSEDGYLLHLKVAPGTGEGCEPRVTRGLLFPIAFDEDASSRRLMLRLYDDLGRLITATRFESRALQAKQLDQAKLRSLFSVVSAMENNSEDARRRDKLANLQALPEYPQLAPFYNSCSQASASNPSVGNAEYYCVCMTYKFGVGERVPRAELAGYARDFSTLVQRASLYNDDNKIYNRLGEVCRRCSNPDRTLHPDCDSLDAVMVSPNTFAGMIGQLEKDILRLETSDFYKENFFIIYLQAYSNYCENEIENPIPFDYVVTEYTTDPYAGTFANEVQRDRTYVERRHAQRYKAIYDKHAKMDPDKFIGAISQMAVTSEADLRRLQSDVSARVRIETEKRRSVQAHLEAGCRSAAVQRVYRRLDELF
ncbi:MAG: hypothetical protein AAF290_03295 [Pseudomonadota bacterium]